MDTRQVMDSEACLVGGMDPAEPIADRRYEAPNGTRPEMRVLVDPCWGERESGPTPIQALSEIDSSNSTRTLQGPGLPLMLDTRTHLNLR